MGIYELLSSKEDALKGGNSCLFNGYLKEYVQTLDDGVVKKILDSVLAVRDDLKIIVGLNAHISKESISNAVIRYKDIFKLENKAVVVPYLIYGKDGETERAVLLSNDHYLYAKGMYYALTEAGAALESGRNDCIAAVLSEDADFLNIFKNLFSARPGRIQRELDKLYCPSYADGFAQAKQLSEQMVANTMAAIAGGEQKEEAINRTVSRWFLLKKFAYAQYMMDKNLLNDVHGGSIKAQRNTAKQNADAIRFVSISELWHLNSSDK